jgi:hypothetical protein
VLNARIVIEVNSANQGRFRLRLRCFRIDPVTGRRTLQVCDFDHTALTCWFDGLISGVCETQADKTAADYVWVGSYRKLVAGHHLHGRRTELQGQVSRQRLPGRGAQDLHEEMDRIPVLQQSRHLLIPTSPST